jgi:hypothetical protein
MANIIGEISAEQGVCKTISLSFALLPFRNAKMMQKDPIGIVLTTEKVLVSVF